MRDNFSTFYSDIPFEKFTAIYYGFNYGDILEAPKEPGNEKIFTVTHAGSFYSELLFLIRPRTGLQISKKIAKYFMHKYIDLG